MICANCQTVNLEDANFCLKCGYRISLNCPRCSRRVASHAAFCDGCGYGITGQPPATQLGSHPLAYRLPLSAAEDRVIGQPGSADQPPLNQPFPSEVAHVKSPMMTQLDIGPQTVRPMPESAAPPPPKALQTLAADSPLAQYIPAGLMAKLENARSSGDMVGERRVVTMLFCDVKGSTAAAEQLDPEEWSEIINGAFEHMIKPVYTYEGTVARLMGDGILAFFGAPLAHEDDPQRAVMAALDMLASIDGYREKIKQTWGIDFNLRVGINTGLVVVGAVGSDLRMEYTALGDAINLAARMEQTAEPGTVQIAYDTHKLVKPLFDFEELGGIAVKGKEEPVQAYRVLGRKGSAGRVRGIEGLHADLVGREVELETMCNLVADLRQGVGRIVCVLGDAGMGKSRLISETRASFEKLPGTESSWYETTSLSYETNQAYGLFQRLIRRVSGITFDDAPRMMQKKLAGLTDDLPEAQRARATQLFEALFGLSSSNGGPPLEGETFKRELGESMLAWWRVWFSKQPTVLVFDDMHWSDSASIDLLKELLPLTTEIGLVMICAFRGDRSAPAWQIKNLADDEFHHRYTQVSLGPLSHSESNELVNRLLTVADIPDGLRENILDKSDGNPFFIEEVVRTLIDNEVVVAEERIIDGLPVRYWVAQSDGSDFSIPDNLQALLAARMDRLEEATRATLQLASVIGRNFYLRVLQAVDETSPEVDKHVSTLLRLDMIRESARVPEIEYAFRNPLTQEAVYRTILLKRRREFHRRVGEAMEQLYADRLDGFYGLLAHHFTLAEERDKAIMHCRLAAQQAIKVYAYGEAEKNLRAALELTQPGVQDEIHLVLLEELADVCRLVRDFSVAIALYQEALRIWEVLPAHEDIIALRLNRKIVEIATDTKWSVDEKSYREYGRISMESQASLVVGIEALSDKQAHPETVRSLVVLSIDAWRIQSPPDWESAHRFAQAAVTMAENLDDPVLLSRALGALANVLDGRSLLREHVAVAQRRLVISQDEAFDDQREKIDTLRGNGVALLYVGEYDRAMPYLEEAARLATVIQATDQIANALGIQAQCLYRLDRWDEVLAIEEKWRDLEQKYPRERIGETCFFVALSGAIHALRGDNDLASEYAIESYDYMVSMSGLPEEWQRNQFY